MPKLSPTSRVSNDFRYFLLLIIILSALVSFTGTATAATPYLRQNGNAPKVEYDVTPYVGIYGLNGPALGVFAAYRVAPNGFIAALNNSVSVEGGLNAGTDCDGSDCQNIFTVSAHMRWDFHLHPNWSAYAAPGIEVGSERGMGHDSVRHGLFAAPKAGGMWWLHQGGAIRFEVDPLMGVHRIGYMFLF